MIHEYSGLTQEQVLEIRKLRAQGFSYERIAKKFGCSVATVINLISEKTGHQKTCRETKYYTDPDVRDR